jgi:ribosome maturation factor RimP
VINQENLENLITKTLEPMGIELVGLKMGGKGNRTVIRVFVDEIDRPGTITIDRCTQANRTIGDLIDRKDLISSNYTLEVSSPGVDWPMKTVRDFHRQLGRKVKLFLNYQDKTIELVGRIQPSESDSEDAIWLEVDGVKQRVPLSQIVKSKIIIEF